MDILVDYDNVDPSFLRPDLRAFGDRVIQCIPSEHFGTPPRARIRLYGGWYDHQILTRRAQGLALQISSAFPLAVAKSDGRKVSVSAELAYALDADPGNHLTNTLRGRPGLPEKLEWISRCADVACPLIPMRDLVAGRFCPKSGCQSRDRDLVRRLEQKLVDTMLTADLLYLARPGLPVCVITSDDDFWPGVRSGLVAGATVLHVHCKPRRRTPLHYSRMAGPKYVELRLY